MELIAYLGTDKNSWGQITGLINNNSWEKIILIKNQDGIDYPSPEYAEEIHVNSEKPINELKKEIIQSLIGKLSGLEVCLSIASGNGKEHMALISALLSIPVGIRFVVFTKNGVELIN